LVECLKRDDVYIFVLETDKGEIKVLIYAELRDAVKNKLDVDTATNCIFLMAEDATKEDYQTLLKWILEYAYSHKCYRADFWNLKVHADWIKELCGEYAQFVDERETPIGSAVKVVIYIKGFVEWLFSR
jgi:predicted ATPase